MSQPEKGKNIFQTAADAISSRDEKAALEAATKLNHELEQRVAQLEQSAAQSAQKLADATKKLAESEQKVTQLTAELSKAQSELTTTRSDLITAKNTVTVMQQRLNATNTELAKYVSAEQAKKIAEAAEAAEKAKIIAEHKVGYNDTLSHLSLKYYGSGYEPYWRVIFEANKDVIGDSPSDLRPGMVLKIPVLPDELKKK